MALADNDIDALRLLMREELRLVMQEELQPRFDAIDERFAQAGGQVEGLYAANEKREQEYLVLSGQMKRIESRLDKIDDRLDRIETRLAALEIRFDTTIERVDRLEAGAA